FQHRIFGDENFVFLDLTSASSGRSAVPIRIPATARIASAGIASSWVASAWITAAPAPATTGITAATPAFGPWGCRIPLSDVSNLYRLFLGIDLDDFCCTDTLCLTRALVLSAFGLCGYEASCTQR